MAKSTRPFGGFLQGSFVIPFRIVFLMWAVFWVEYQFNFDFSNYGILPRRADGLIGILLAPLLHGSYAHILSNTVPMLFLGTVLFYFYDRIATTVYTLCYLGTGVLVWLMARPSYHIGASGVVYALASFLIFFGIFRRDIIAILISIVIIFMYGGLIYGVLPLQQGVSWESHLFGGLLGGFLAWYFAKIRRVRGSSDD